MPFKWTQEYDSAFNLLKEILCSYPILRNPDFSRPFILYTDESHIAYGAIDVLSQIEDHGQEYVVAYASKLLTLKSQSCPNKMVNISLRH